MLSVCFEVIYGRNRFSNDNSGLNIGGIGYQNEDFERLLACQSPVYQISVNDSVYQNLKFHFYEHPDKGQKGLLTTISTAGFSEGKNVLKVRKIQADSLQTLSSFDSIPFWYRGEQKKAD